MNDDEILATWLSLNAVTREADELTCLRLLKKELRGKARQQFVLRLHSRLNRVRADRERGELLICLGDVKSKSPAWLR